MPDPAILRDDFDGVLICLGEVELKMTEPQLVRLWEALNERYQAHATVGNTDTEQEI